MGSDRRADVSSVGLGLVTSGLAWAFGATQPVGWTVGAVVGLGSLAVPSPEFYKAGIFYTQSTLQHGNHRTIITNGYDKNGSLAQSHSGGCKVL